MTEKHDTDSLAVNSEQSDQSTEDVKTESKTDSWQNHLSRIWHDTSKRLIKLFPVDQAVPIIMQWFTVDEAKVAEILVKVRAELPTTEAILIGKPQTGKSSIVGGLTGVSAEIVGQGFRPHTQHMERYAYPSDDLPLLIFTDTVGLGDVKQQTSVIIDELLSELQQESNRARILILTVKINDFATDTLRQIAEKLQQEYPNIPCLLTVTCLHEVYPNPTDDHPEYPPEYEELNR
ncbi:MAG: 50S ribosome-binding GTPase, partial [Trichodesmium sp. MAG_R04]|nr:50S ribosome-binding GTPase [Trichodesmium sp. MAG_R04]